MSKSSCNVLAIQGSFQKTGNTTIMLKHAVEQAKQCGHEVTYVNLFEKNIGYCKGCKKCVKGIECVFKDDIVDMVRLIKEADVIILAAPVYWGNVPAIVKNLMDRMRGASMADTATFPKPKLKGKRYILLTACNTIMPFAKLCGQSTGISRVVKEYFKTSGVKKIGMVVCDNSGKLEKVPDRKLNKVSKLVKEI